MGKIILGLIITSTSFMLVWKTSWFIYNFGRIPWFEQHMHSLGGSWLAYKIFGIIGIVTGLLIATDLSGEAAEFLFGWIFRAGTK